MKNLIGFLFIAFLFSCGDDDDATTSESIIGQWRLASLSITDCADEDNDIPTINADNAGCLTANTTMLCQTIVFNANGTGVNTSITDGETDSQDFTYTIDDVNNSVTTCDENNNCNTFMINNGRISISNPFGDCTINPIYTQS